MTAAPETIIELLHEYHGGGEGVALLGEIARAVGFRLAHARGDDLVRLRSTLAEAERSSLGEDPMCQGVVLALHEAVAAYAIELGSIVERERLAAHWRSTDTLRSSLIQQLDRGPERPSCLAQRLDKAVAQISRAAGDLEREGLVEKVPVRDDGRGTWYRLTPRGARVASVLRESGRSRSAPSQSLVEMKIPPGILKLRDATARARSTERAPTRLKGEQPILQENLSVAGAGVDR